MKYKNPIIPGFHPDPSICRVGADYYLVHSTFEFFPGVPLYHSKNLINWELKGYCLDRKEQLYLDGCRPSGGIYAPTIRYHNGIFFMTTTNVSDRGNFIVHTEDPAKGWSDPAWVKQGGIDPSLLFEDGKVYFTSASMDEEGRAAILLCEIDPYTGGQLTESVVISHGCGGRYPEGPHLYKRFGTYYLMLAEGGTEYGHRETILRAAEPYGPYEACPHNPILSNQELMDGEINCTGHADIIEDHQGNWWLVCLAVRPSGDPMQAHFLHHLGRETYLAPVKWTEDGWPLVGTDGTIGLEMDGPLPGPEPTEVKWDFRDDFTDEAYSLRYNFLRNPDLETYLRKPEQGELQLVGTDMTLNDQASPTWLGIRQQAFEITAWVKVSVPESAVGSRAGLTAFYNHSYHYEICLTQEEDEEDRTEVSGVKSPVLRVCLAKRVHDIFTVTASAEIPAAAAADGVILEIAAARDSYRFSYCIDGETFNCLGTGLAVGLCTEGMAIKTFTGTYIAMFAERGVGVFRDFEVK